MEKKICERENGEQKKRMSHTVRAGGNERVGALYKL